MRDQTCQTSSPSNFLPLSGLFYILSVHTMKHDSSNNYTLEQTDQDYLMIIKTYQNFAIFLWCVWSGGGKIY